jgi:hypothetical protein
MCIDRHAHRQLQARVVVTRESPSAPTREPSEPKLPLLDAEGVLPDGRSSSLWSDMADEMGCQSDNKEL